MLIKYGPIFPEVYQNGLVSSQNLIAFVLNKYEISTSELIGIGISCGGPLNSKAGTINCPPNLPDWDNVPIVKIFSERFNTRVVLHNDANACAVAEWRFGAGRGAENMVFLTFGTGMGAGLILNGKLYSGRGTSTDIIGSSIQAYINALNKIVYEEAEA